MSDADLIQRLQVLSPPAASRPNIPMWLDESLRVPEKFRQQVIDEARLV